MDYHNFLANFFLALISFSKQLITNQDMDYGSSISPRDITISTPILI